MTKINCLECYRLQHCGGTTYYCPFFDIQPCCRGEHYIAKPESEKRSRLGVRLEGTKSLITAGLLPKIPKFIPPKKQIKEGAVNWEQYHKQIFDLLNGGYTVTATARELGLTPSAVRGYVQRYPAYPLKRGGGIGV